MTTSKKLKVSRELLESGVDLEAHLTASMVAAIRKLQRADQASELHRLIHGTGKKKPKGLLTVRPESQS